MSNVLVIHPDDRSTDMLKVVYEGKGYDVITDMSVSEEKVVEAIKSHDTIIMLGHGTPSGLLLLTAMEDSLAMLSMMGMRSS